MNDVYDVERLHEIYGYQQDNLLFEDQVDLFAKGPGVGANFQGALYEGKDGVRRLWTGHWGGVAHFAFMPIYGFMIDHRQAQLVVDISPDGKSAWVRARTSSDQVVQHRTAMKDPAGAGTDMNQSVIYENEYVKQDGIWKFKLWRLYIYGDGPVGAGYADLPLVPGKSLMGNIRNGGAGWLDDVPEGDMSLFPGNQNGPDRAETSEQSGCFVAKDQTMIHSLLVPFHYPNPVTGKPVTWVNK